MNKDLEIIKRSMTGNGKYRDELTDEVIAAAERMSAEIERLKNEVNETQVVYYSVLKESKQYRNEAVRLKAELEKRPEVVRCGECKYRGTGCCPFLEGDEPDEFCSRGKRKESEEK